MKERDDFYRLFGEKMREQTAPDFSEQDWPALANRLDQADRKRPFVLPVWWPWLLGGLLVLSNLGWFFFMKFSKTGLEATETHVVCDTIFQQTTVIRTDTVFQKVWLKSPVLPARFSEKRDSQTVENQAVFSEKSVAGFEKTAADKTADNSFSTSDGRKIATDFSTPKGALNGPIDPLFQKMDSLKMDENGGETSDFSSKSILSVLSSGLPFLVDCRWPPLVIIHSEPSKPFVFQTPASENSVVTRSARSGWTSLGLVGGRLIPIGYGLHDRRGFVAGLVAERGLTKNLSANLEAAVGGVRCRGFYLDGYGIGGSDIQSPGPGYRLRSFEIIANPKKDVRLGLGLRWRFWPGWKLHPFVGAGWLMDFERSFDMQTNWYQQGIGGSLSVPFHLSGSDRPISFAEANAGLEFSFSARLSLSVCGFYDDKLGIGEEGLPGYKGLKSWLTWRF